jgi:hypothetical protein
MHLWLDGDSTTKDSDTESLFVADTPKHHLTHDVSELRAICYLGLR